LGWVYLFQRLGEIAMPTAVRIIAPIPASAISSKKSDSSDFVAVALFSTIGLLASLIAILAGVPGVWY
jgi:hypothetical protein